MTDAAMIAFALLGATGCIAGCVIFLRVLRAIETVADFNRRAEGRERTDLLAFIRQLIEKREHPGNGQVTALHANERLAVARQDAVTERAAIRSQTSPAVEPVTSDASEVTEDDSGIHG